MDPEPSVANTVGAHLIGSFFAICLFGVVLMQIYNCFLTFPDDKWPLKLLVSIICLLEIGHSIGIVYDVYETNIINDVRNNDVSEFKGSALATAFGGIITFLVQSFFATRLYRLFPNPWRFIGPFCIILSAARLAGNFYLAYHAFSSHSFDSYVSFNGWLITSLLSVGASIDLVIALSMIYYLRKQRGNLLNRCSGVIDKLILWTFRSGLIPSLSALGMLIAFQVAPRTSYWTALFVLLAKLYSSSMISALNGRQHLRNSLFPTTTIDLDVLSTRSQPTSRGCSLTSTAIKQPRTATDVTADSSSIQFSKLPRPEIMV